ncbi:sigma-E processing peptidase SpoIIGA [Flavonifractor sp. DFI.6.63]|uniref:Sporulation sigma-E factor-processing peptidase n=1 Tax=Lawsonibacter hominis TaxID=2763053 RepID=A0A8J6MEQ0_9FIRM|nr:MULTISPECIES: sigma-E processing peptidase SpoIIGA [Oscillospiraceae]MBS1384100.1 sigma-E processing peptidase SpoIIGA [Flavonifractor sp.]MDU2195889.1 sigma-E processing peptidase SpoIIGA [Clostridiales bacterium]MDY2977294.1 sigma-E processing peptidase SpoIIGA [Oscillospiraceae bacterium]MBC5733278.1 sigma-E processing peptidase SpoIIGA [Lawsonibacter hominis]MCI6399232.1 sigma-E processing peptidase SpoIIGA [Lawsonibacter sp.]
MTVVYIDALFLLNFVVDYLLLLCAGRLAGEVLHRGRLALGAALAGAYAAAVFLPGMGFLLHPLCKLAAAVLALLIGYGGSRRLLRVTLVFFAVSAAFAGGILALELLGGRGLTLENGVFSSAMDLRLILLSAAGCYVVITLLFQRSARHTAARQELVPAVLTLDGRRVALTALVDTGNTLTDPATGRPVMVAEGEKVAGLFPSGQAPDEADLRDPVAALERLSQAGFLGRCRLLPYQAVGVECGMLLSLRLDGARVGREDYGTLLVALSPNRLSDGGGYSALIGT